MAAKQRSTVVGVFEDRRHADQAVADLKKAGFRDDQIGVAMRHTEGSIATDATTADETDSHAGSGAMAGALTGLGLGALAGLGVLAGVIPVIGPAIAGGTLGVILSNAAVGAGAVGLAGALIGAGIPEEEATYYHNEFEAGRTIVTVNADGRYDEAWAIVNRHGAYDMSTRGSVAARTTAPAVGSTSHGAARATTTTTGAAANVGAARGTATHEGDTIQVKEERLLAEKRPVEAGEVRVHKEVHTETRNIEVPVKREEVVIERTPTHGKVMAGEIREGEEIRIPVREEQVKLGKEVLVTEEVKVGKQVVQGTEHVTGQVRKEEVHVDREGDVDVRNRGTGKGKV